MRTLRLHQSNVKRGSLIVVNPAHRLEDEGAALMAVNEAHADVLMTVEAARALQACMAAVQAQEAIVPVSGWRSMAEQQQIWVDSIAANGEAFTRQYVAIVGASEHQSGLAIDLAKAAGEIDFICPDFPYDGICGEFRKLAPHYGFIERYQAGKEALTEISAEPWHFRYVGVPHAQIMTEHGLCLEEYPDFLREKPRRVRTPDGRSARVCHVTATAEWITVGVPEGDIDVSGDNIDGFILTIWEPQS